jgi:SAM-dependent methyltransferase
MLEVAREICPNTRFVCADLTQETADLGLFDVVTSFRFFGNAQHELRVGALQALNRLLRPDGHLIINSHRNPHALAALLHNATGGAHGMDLNYFKLKGLLRAHGFRIVYRRAIGFWLFRARLMRQAQLSKAPDWFLESMFRYPCFVPFAPDVVVLAEKSKAL